MDMEFEKLLDRTQNKIVVGDADIVYVNNLAVKAKFEQLDRVGVIKPIRTGQELYGRILPVINNAGGRPETLYLEVRDGNIGPFFSESTRDLLVRASDSGAISPAEARSVIYQLNNTLAGRSGRRTPQVSGVDVAYISQALDVEIRIAEVSNQFRHLDYLVDRLESAGELRPDEAKKFRQNLSRDRALAGFYVHANALTDFAAETVAAGGNIVDLQHPDLSAHGFQNLPGRVELADAAGTFGIIYSYGTQKSVATPLGFISQLPLYHLDNITATKIHYGFRADKQAEEKRTFTSNRAIYSAIDVWTAMDSTQTMRPVSEQPG
jgi:hypothetical protein